MKLGRPSFAAVIERRFRRAGKAVVEGGHPYFAPVDRLEAGYASAEAGFVSFAHYDYLGLSRHPEIASRAKDAIDTLGTGVGASRLVGGERSAHQALERDLADFLGLGSTLCLISGYLSNLTIINHLLGAPDLVIFDELAHNSIVVGAKSGRFQHMTFRHNDLDDLEGRLAAVRNRYRHVLVVVEGLYSMDGDMPDLPRLMELKQRHDVWLLVDEAHSYGVLGKTGRGVCEHFGIDPRLIDVSIGTLSKSFVSSGGFVGASAELIDYLRFTLPGFVYSVGLSPASVASAHAALDQLRRIPERVTRLKQNSQLFLELASKAGLNTGNAVGEGVIPVLFDTPEQTMAVSQALMDRGIYAPPIVQVGIPRDQPRIRFFISAAHRGEDIERTIDIAAATLSADLPARTQPLSLAH